MKHTGPSICLTRVWLTHSVVLFNVQLTSQAATLSMPNLGVNWAMGHAGHSDYGIRLLVWNIPAVAVMSGNQ